MYSFNLGGHARFLWQNVGPTPPPKKNFRKGPIDVAGCNKKNALVERMMRKDKENDTNEQCKRIGDSSIT